MTCSAYKVTAEELAFTKEFIDALGRGHSTLEVRDVKQGWGEMCFGKGLRCDELRVKDRVFGWGLGGHADSEIEVRSSAPMKSLRGFCGMESNEVTRQQQAKTKTVFSILDGETVLWKSKPLDLHSEAEEFQIELTGQRTLTLRAIADNPMNYGHIEWCELVAENSVGDKLPIGGAGKGKSVAADFLPIDLKVGTETFVEFAVRCGVERQERDGKTVLSSFDAKSGLAIELTMKRHKDLPVCEWRLALENKGGKPTPRVSDVKSLALKIPRMARQTEMKLLRGRGSFNTPQGGAKSFDQSFLPVLDTLAQNTEVAFGAHNGRAADPWLPFFNIKFPGDNGGLVFAIGWAGQWHAKASNSSIEAGIEKFDASLLPGERLEFPAIYLLRYDGAEMLRGNNLLRRFIREDIAPRYDGKPIVPPVSSMAWGGMTEAKQLERIEVIGKRKLPVDVYWIDAGWYAPPSDSEFDPEWGIHVGDWRFNPDIFPHGTKPVADAANKAGMKFLLWVEPERAVAGTILPTEHPDWFLGETGKGANLLLNLGNKDACDWCIDYISSLVEKHGVDFYREDFNIAPLPYWRGNDAPDRQGVTEVKAIAGLYRFWGELRRRFPKLMIDNCASGGRRIEIELLRHSVPLWSSDMMCFPDFPSDAAQTHVSGLSLWVPLFGNGTQNHEGGDTYKFRSAMAAGVSIQFIYRGDWPITEDYPTEWLRTRLEEFHAVKDCFSGDFHPLVEEISLSPKIWSVSQFDRPDLGRGVVTTFRRDDAPFTRADMQLKGLVSDALYELHDFDSGKTWTQRGSELLEKGLSIEMPERHSSRIIAYQMK